jgi:hypothetical protein
MPKYGRSASKNVERAMRRRKRGTLRSGSGRKVTSPEQAIAIGLSEAREKGAKVPPPPSRGSSARKRSARKTTGRTTAAHASAGDGTSARKSTRRASGRTARR